MSIERMINFELFDFIFALQLNLLCEMIRFGRVTLTDYDFYHVFSFENFIDYDRYVYDFDLNKKEITSCLIDMSTVGLILSISS